jgi:hypothetical protein
MQEEHFAGFIAVEETTAATFTDTIFKELSSLGLDTNDCRGQGYDNVANMAGVNSGVNTKTLPINPQLSLPRVAVTSGICCSEMKPNSQECQAISFLA